MNFLKSHTFYLVISIVLALVSCVHFEAYASIILKNNRLASQGNCSCPKHELNIMRLPASRTGGTIHGWNAGTKRPTTDGRG